MNTPFYKLIMVEELKSLRRKKINVDSKQLKIQHCYEWNVIIHEVYHVPFHLASPR